MFACSPSVLPCKAKEGWDFWIANTPAYEACTKEVQLFETFNISGVFRQDYNIIIVFLIHFPCLLFRFARSDGGMNTKPSSVAKKMLNISVKQKRKNTPSKTFTHLTKVQNQHPSHLPLPKWRSRLPLQNPNPRD